METSLSLLGFAVAASVTPGPNNLIISAMAASGGWRAPLPAMLGVAFGFALLLIIAALGLAAPLAASPTLHTGQRWVGALWLLRMAWLIGRAPPPEVTTTRRGFGFFAAAAFQWVNPKAWVMAIGAITTYTPSQGYIANVFIIALVFAIINLPSVCVWAGCGSALRSVLTRPRWLLAFNLTMAMLLVVSLYPILFDVH